MCIKWAQFSKIWKLFFPVIARVLSGQYVSSLQCQYRKTFLVSLFDEACLDEWRERETKQGSFCPLQKMSPKLGDSGNVSKVFWANFSSRKQATLYRPKRWLFSEGFGYKRALLCVSTVQYLTAIFFGSKKRAEPCLWKDLYNMTMCLWKKSSLLLHMPTVETRFETHFQCGNQDKQGWQKAVSLKCFFW